MALGAVGGSRNRYTYYKGMSGDLILNSFMIRTKIGYTNYECYFSGISDNNVELKYVGPERENY